MRVLYLLPWSLPIEQRHDRECIFLPDHAMPIYLLGGASGSHWDSAIDAGITLGS